MAQKKYSNFPSKVLLFGEYLVLSNGDSLSIPYHELFLEKIFHAHSNKHFQQQILNHVQSLDIFKDRIDPKWKEDIGKGLHFQSNIPVGYGLGSSGALIAALYSDYILNQSEDLNQLKIELSLMENFFHDTSSGIDPLTSYVQMPLRLSNNQISVIESPLSLNNFYILDSNIRRNAKKAIQHFHKIYQSKTVQHEIKLLTEISNSIIQNTLLGKNIKDEMKAYSNLQYKLFFDFIPESISNIWTEGLNTDSYYVKLCGAGMGGMFLVYSENPIMNLKHLKTRSLSNPF